MFEAAAQPDRRSLLGNYLLVEQLGNRTSHGTTSQTWRALACGPPSPIPARDERPVLLKRLRPERLAGVDDQRLFTARTTQLRKLVHLNLNRMLAASSPMDENPFVVVELVEGLDLAALLSLARATRTRLPASLVIFIIAQAARGLAALHEADPGAHRPGLLHRNIAPRNILLGRDGRVELCDVLLVTAPTIDGLPSERLRYLAPEQLTGEPLDPRTDLYALGVVLYEALYDAGEPPDGRLAASLRSGTGEVGAPIPRSLQPLVTAMVALDRAVRPASAAEVASRLDRYLAACASLWPRDELRALIAYLAAPELDTESNADEDPERKSFEASIDAPAAQTPGPALATAADPGPDSRLRQRASVRAIAMHSAPILLLLLVSVLWSRGRLSCGRGSASQVDPVSARPSAALRVVAAGRPRISIRFGEVDVALVTVEHTRHGALQLHLRVSNPTATSQSVNLAAAHLVVPSRAALLGLASPTVAHLAPDRWRDATITFDPAPPPLRIGSNELIRLVLGPGAELGVSPEDMR